MVVVSRTPESILVIHDGSLPALAACLMAPELEAVVAWAPASGSSLRGVGAEEHAQRAMVHQQAELLGFRAVVTAPAVPAAPNTPKGIEQTMSLLAAVSSAVELGCSRVVWPVTAGEDFEQLAEAAERAALVNRLCWLDADQPSRERAPRAVRLDTPFLDLTGQQVLDIARDLGAPLQICWMDSQVPV